jgi:hypothetical protein
MTDRGVHPDLIDDEPSPAPEAPSPRRGRAARAAPPAESPPAAATEPAEPAQTAEPEPASEAPAEEARKAEPPEWWQQVKDASDPKAALALITKNLPKTELEQDPTLQGWIGDMSQRRALALQQQQEQERIEQQKREMLANGDYYGLGQLTAPELERRVQQIAAQQQGAPFMDGVTQFQSQLPAEVQAAVQGKTFGAGKSYSEGVSEYLAAVTEASVSHRLNDAIEKELKRREPALRKAWLSESNGDQPVPELEGGRASGVREITDEQIGRMTLDEYDTYMDANGQPRPGVRVRLTRGISTRQQR